ncbi:MAG: OmpA family protein, partial [Proteobacteria bacterium]
SYAVNKDKHPDQTYVSSVEVLAGAKRRLARNFWGHFGATAEVLPKGLAPDFRIYAGLNYFFGFGPESNINSSASTLEVFPREINLAQQEKQTVTVTGGAKPYSYELSKNMGRFDQDILEYTAGNQMGNDELIVSDADGATASVPITIRDKSSMGVTPSDSTVYTGGVVQYSVSGGRAPYRASLSPANFGSISNLRYIAPTRDGVVEIIIRDQLGQTARARVHVVPIPKAAREIELKNLNFDFDTDRLTKASEIELDRNIAAISDVKINKMIVVGHTDSKGSDIYNQNLSQKRAETVAKILRNRFNLRTDQVEAVGYGEAQPIATNETELGRLKNRRCELKMYYDN